MHNHALYTMFWTVSLEKKEMSNVFILVKNFLYIFTVLHYLSIFPPLSIHLVLLLASDFVQVRF